MVAGAGVLAGGVGEAVAGTAVPGTAVPVPDPPDGTAGPLGVVGVVVAVGSGAGAGAAVGGAGGFVAAGADDGSGAAVAADDALTVPVATAARTALRRRWRGPAVADAVAQSSASRAETAASPAVIGRRQRPSR